MKQTLLICIFGFLLIGCSSSESENTENRRTEQDAAPAQKPEKPQPENKPMEYVVLETEKGDINLELDPNKAPITVNNFLKYVDDGFYDGTIFHRVMPNFMIQGGGFTADGVKKETRSPIELESKNGLSNTVGTIAMARGGSPNSATAQFFINVASNENIDYRPGFPGYAVFGRVTSGMDVVNEIRQLETGVHEHHKNWPVEPVRIIKARRE